MVGGNYHTCLEKQVNFKALPYLSICSNPRCVWTAILSLSQRGLLLALYQHWPITVIIF